MEFTREQKTQVITNIVGFYEGIYNIMSDLLDRVEDEEIGKADPFDLAIDAIDNGLIYTDDIWEVMKYYQTPQDANQAQAIENLTEDLAKIIEELAEGVDEQ